MADQPVHQKLKETYQTLVAEMAIILRRADPLELVSVGAPRDEYDEEVARLVAKLRTASSPADVQVVLREVFGGWREGTSDSPSCIERVASEIWQVWQRQMGKAG
jgi:hypothetical protein